MRVSRRDAVRSLGLLAASGAGLTACTRTSRGGRPSTEPVTTTAPPKDPSAPLVLGSIGVASGLESQFEKQISIAIGEARTDVDVAGGVFGRDVTMLPRQVVDAIDTDLTPIVADLARQNASAVVVSCGEPSLRAAMPAFAEAGIAVVSVTSTARDLRAADAGAAGMLLRMAPTDRCLASAFAEASRQAGQGATPGTIAYLGRDSMHGRSLAEELRLQVEPAGGELRPVFFPEGAPDLGAPLDAIAADPPALVVIDAGDETARILSALYARTTGTDRQHLSVPIRTTYYNSHAWGGRVPGEGMEHVTGTRAGAPPSDALENTLLNIDPSLATAGFDFGGQAYDAVTLLALAAQTAHSLEGSRIAGALPALLRDGTDVTTYADALDRLRDGQDVRYRGASGTLVLGDDGDPVSVDMSTVAFDRTGAVTQVTGATITLS